jgi:FixJ family two-component response regulator
MSEEQRDRLKEFGIEDFLDKPYRDQDVIASVKRILARGRAVSSAAANARSVKPPIEASSLSQISR